MSSQHVYLVFRSNRSTTMLTVNTKFCTICTRCRSSAALGRLNNLSPIIPPLSRFATIHVILHCVRCAGDSRARSFYQSAYIVCACDSDKTLAHTHTLTNDIALSATHSPHTSIYTATTSTAAVCAHARCHRHRQSLSCWSRNRSTLAARALLLTNRVKFKLYVRADSPLSIVHSVQIGGSALVLSTLSSVCLSTSFAPGFFSHYHSVNRYAEV